MTTDEPRPKIYTQLQVIAPPCAKDAHDLCPKRVELGLWGVELLCGCECHDA